MRRNFGPIKNNHVPAGGYRQPQFSAPTPHFYSESRRVSLPLPERYLESLSLLPAQDTHEAIDNGYHEYGVELGNPNLPIHAYRTEIAQAVISNPITIVVGETGSGKSTQMAQFLLDAGFDRVFLTQPRRIASYTVADRIQEELTGALGVEKAAGLVGYQTAEKSTITPRSRIHVLTDGIEAVRQLNEEKFSSREVHILDEVHEWNTNIEVSVAVAKKRLGEDPRAKFVLTSATMDAHRLAHYVGEATGSMPPVIEVPGRTYPIAAYENPGSTVVDEVIGSVTANPDKDILVFVAGKREISDTIDAVRRRLPRTIAKTTTILPLHAKLPKEDQDLINRQYPGLKIIVSTNVAQTSLTIEGIDVVIDSGQERHVQMDDEGVEGLNVYPISQADCDQRRGRTGRLGPGTYILTRYDTNTEHVQYIDRPKYPKAEILRTGIDRTTLRTAAVGIDLARFDLFHPIDKNTVRSSKESLIRLGALNDEGQITGRGLQMNEFPVMPSSGRMLVEAYQYSAEVRAYLSAMLASREVGGLPYFAHDVGKNWKRLTNERSSDLFAQLDIFIASQNMNDAELAGYDLDVQNIRRAQELHAKIVRISDAYGGELIPPSTQEREAILQCIVAGMVDEVYQHAGGGNYETVSPDADRTQRELSNRSVVSGRPQYVVGSPYRVHYMKAGEARERHILETVTVLEDPRILGEVALERCIWATDRTIWRDDRLKEVRRLSFNGALDLGIETEVEAEPTPENRERLLASLLESPGSAQKELRAIKSQLEALQRISAYEIPVLTQDDLINLLWRAMGDGLLDKSHVDHNLRVVMELEDITLDRFVPRKERERIIANAPPDVTVAGYNFQLRYVNGNPVTFCDNLEVLDVLPGDITIPDGRQVYFIHQKKLYDLQSLRVILENGSTVT